MHICRAIEDSFWARFRGTHGGSPGQRAQGQKCTLGLAFTGLWLAPEGRRWPRVSRCRARGQYWRPSHPPKWNSVLPFHFPSRTFMSNMLFVSWNLVCLDLIVYACFQICTFSWAPRCFLPQKFFGWWVGKWVTAFIMTGFSKHRKCAWGSNIADHPDADPDPDPPKPAKPGRDHVGDGEPRLVSDRGHFRSILPTTRGHPQWKTPISAHFFLRISTICH